MTDKPTKKTPPTLTELHAILDDHRQALQDCLTCLNIWDIVIESLPLHQLTPDTPWGILLDAVQDAIASYSSPARTLMQKADQ